MKGSFVFWAPLLAVLVDAQSAPGFEFEVADNLRVEYASTNTSITPPGVLLDRLLLTEAPTIYAPNGSTEERTYMVFMMDQDVPFNDSRINLLHWFQPNLFGTNETLAVAADAPNATSSAGGVYTGPNPPEGDGPHRYTFVLYAQPADFTVPETYDFGVPLDTTSSRLRFNMTAFAAEFGLGEPLAANYLRVLNGTAAETSSAATATATATSTASDSESTSDSTSAPTTDASATETDADSTASATESAASETGTSESGASAISRRGITELAAGLVLGVIGAGMFVF